MPGSWRIEVRYFPEGHEGVLERSNMQSALINDEDLLTNISAEEEFVHLFEQVCEAVNLEPTDRL